MEVNHDQGKRVTSDQLRHERAQPGFDSKQHTNIDVEHFTVDGKATQIVVEVGP
jgi:hypothetical protein